ncbi:MAG: hypothetical protein OHK005_05750 [Candidatus Methylacidiphilales bacterium]
MKYVATIIAVLLGIPPLAAVDISPSRENIPERFRTGGGKRFSIFAGDPERVQRANEIRFSDFSAEVTIDPPEISLAALRANSLELKPKMLFRVFNNGKRNYILSFPDAQRFDYIILDPEGRLIYEWSADKMFVQAVGSSNVNPKERLTYSDEMPLAELVNKLRPGAYTVKAILANYPEITAEQTFRIVP